MRQSNHPHKESPSHRAYFDETAGKGKTQLHFEEVEKRPNGRLRHNPLSRPIHEIVHAAHAKVYEVEQENVGVEAGHKGEVLTERGLAYGKAKSVPPSTITAQSPGVTRRRQSRPF